MTPRLDYQAFSPDALAAMHALEHYLSTCGLDHALIHLLKMRASQINGCAFCLDMHSIDARGVGETEQRLYALSAWRETPFFTDRERAAHAWIEALTLVATSHVPDEVFAEVQAQFNNQEVVDLTYLAAAINSWNRIAVATRAVPEVTCPWPRRYGVMTGTAPRAHDCPDCEDPLVFAFLDTSGVGAHKRGDRFNTTPDTRHYVCWSCAKAWKQRLDGPPRPDVVGDLALLTCREPECGRPLTLGHGSAPPSPVALVCASGHQHVVRALDDGLTVERAH